MVARLSFDYGQELRSKRLFPFRPWSWDNGCVGRNVRKSGGLIYEYCSSFDKRHGAFRSAFFLAHSSKVGNA